MFCARAPSHTHPMCQHGNEIQKKGQGENVAHMTELGILTF